MLLSSQRDNPTNFKNIDKSRICDDTGFFYAFKNPRKSHRKTHGKERSLLSPLVILRSWFILYCSVRVPVKVFQSMVILTSADFLLLDFLKPLSPSCLIIFISTATVNICQIILSEFTERIISSRNVDPVSKPFAKAFNRCNGFQIICLSDLQHCRNLPL